MRSAWAKPVFNLFGIGVQNQGLSTTGNYALSGRVYKRVLLSTGMGMFLLCFFHFFFNVFISVLLILLLLIHTTYNNKRLNYLKLLIINRRFV